MAASKLVITRAGTGWASRSACDVPFIISITDAGGTPDPTWRGSIVASIANGGTGPSTLAGPHLMDHIYTQNTGALTFRRLKLVGPGAGVTITFTAIPAAGHPALTLVTSAAITVGAQTGQFVVLRDGTVTNVELPRATPDATYPTINGTVVGPFSTIADIQAAINTIAAYTSAGVGLANGTKHHEILVTSGLTLTGHLVPPVRDDDCTGEIITRCVESLPIPTGARGQCTLLDMGARAILRSPDQDPVIKTADWAGGRNPHHYRFAGLVMDVAPGVAVNYGLVAFGNSGGTTGNQTSLDRVAHHLGIDRCYVTGIDGFECRHGVLLDCAYGFVVKSSVVKFVSAGYGDCTAISGWNGPGPLLIEDTDTQGSGESYIFGGNDSAIPELVPADITIRRGRMFKPAAWDPDTGTGYQTKNLLDLKNATRVLVEGVEADGSYGPAQDSWLFVIKSVNQGGTAPWSGTSDVTVRYCPTRNASPAHKGDMLTFGGSPEFKPAVNLSCVAAYDNPGWNVGGFHFAGGGYIFGLIVDHNTARTPASKAGYSNYLGDDGTVIYDYRNTNNLVDVGTNQGTRSQSFFPPALFASTVLPPPYTFRNNALANRLFAVEDQDANFPVPNWMDGVTSALLGFTSTSEAAWDTADVLTILPRLLLSSGLYRAGQSRQATDGTNLGADISAVIAALTGTPLVPGAVVALSFDPAPVGVLSNAAFGCTVKAVDHSGLVVTSFTGRVRLFLAIGRGQLTGTLEQTAVAGVATFSGLKLRNTRGPVEIAAITEDA